MLTSRKAAGGRCSGLCHSQPGPTLLCGFEPCAPRLCSWSAFALLCGQSSVSYFVCLLVSCTCFSVSRSFSDSSCFCFWLCLPGSFRAEPEVQVFMLGRVGRICAARFLMGQSSSCEPEPTQCISLEVTLGLNEASSRLHPFSHTVNQAQSLKSVPERPVLTYAGQATFLEVLSYILQVYIGRLQ